MGLPAYDSAVLPPHRMCYSFTLIDSTAWWSPITVLGWAFEVQECEQRGFETTLLGKGSGIIQREISVFYWSDRGRRWNGFYIYLDFLRFRFPRRSIFEDPRSSSPSTRHRKCQKIAPERSIAGSKRRTEEMEVPQEGIHGHCSSHVSQKPSRKLRKSGHEKRPSEDSACSTKERPIAKEVTATQWDSLPTDLLINILLRVDFRTLFRCKTLSKSCGEVIRDDSCTQTWSSEGSFTAINYYIKDRIWRCSAYDLHSKSWKALKPFSFLPAPDALLFKEYSVTGHGGLMCADVSKLPQRGKLVVFNPLTEESRVLPPLLHPRIPVLVHLIADSVQRSFKVVVAGSSAAGDEHLSKKVEVFDSSTSEWKEACDLPGPAFGLNEHQSGVCLNGKLFFISFLEGDCRRGVVAFDVEKGEWLKNLVCPIPFSSFANTLQLVESDGKVYLFSEQERGCSVEHCIDELEFPDRDAGAMSCRLRNVVRVKKAGGRGLQVYPEHVCAGFGEGRLCIFNTLNRTGVVYEMRGGKQCEELQAPPADQMGENFFSLNPASFTFQPNLAKL